MERRIHPGRKRTKIGSGRKLCKGRRYRCAIVEAGYFDQQDIGLAHDPINRGISPLRVIGKRMDCAEYPPFDAPLRIGYFVQQRGGRFFARTFTAPAIPAASGESQKQRKSEEAAKNACHC
jgi:hypothetical protein